jgi:uncharacterized RmlC-like cupin family protein
VSQPDTGAFGVTVVCGVSLTAPASALMMVRTMGPDERPVDDTGQTGDGQTGDGQTGDGQTGDLVHDPVRVVHSLSHDTAQTPGMHRLVAIDAASVGAKRLWFGRVTCPPGLNSGPHHHGEAETAGHMISGDRIRIYFGQDYHEYVDIEPGDFLFVPAYTPHIEVNMSDTVAAEFFTARSPDNIVVNLDEDNPHAVGDNNPGSV